MIIAGRSLPPPLPFAFVVSVVVVATVVVVVVIVVVVVVVVEVVIVRPASNPSIDHDLSSPINSLSIHEIKFAPLSFPSTPGRDGGIVAGGGSPHAAPRLIVKAALPPSLAAGAMEERVAPHSINGSHGTADEGLPYRSFSSFPDDDVVVVVVVVERFDR